MKKIDLIELMDENNTKPKDQGETWVDVLENIKRESNNFDLETMCNICIKQISSFICYSYINIIN